MLAMEFKVKYDQAADALYIKFKDDKVVDSEETAPGIVVDYLVIASRSSGVTPSPDYEDL